MTVAEVFRPKTVREAKDIILTPENGMTPDERWERETPWIVEQVNNLLTPGDVVIDFGSGVGRVAREIGRRHIMVAVDASPEMRKMCIDYCDGAAPGVTVTDPWGLNGMASRGLQADGALCIWSLQHIRDLDTHVRWLANAIKPGGWVFVLNSQSRWLPIENGWAGDAQSVQGSLVKHRIIPKFRIELPADLFGSDKWCAVYYKEVGQ